MRRVLAAAIVVLVGASSARAQPGTAEGVDAFVRGDYRRAAEILRPIAEQAPQPDAVAAFFMAAMYDTGLGIPADPIRACALYLRADSPTFGAARSPFGAQAMAIMTIRRATISQEAFEQCTWMASNGFDHGFEPVTFVLGPGHWISWDVRGSTITYEGKEKRLDAPLGRNRSVFLPLRYSELAVGPTRSAHRHFFEILTWQPTGKPQEWTLQWSLTEVVRSDLLRIASAPLTTVSAPAAPVDRSFDVRTMVRLAVNDDGDAEWSLLSGPNRATTVIETEADRADLEEARLRARAKDAAGLKIDWTRHLDLHRHPALAYADTGTCMRAIIGESADRTETITVHSEASLRDLPSVPRTFDLATRGGGFEVTVQVKDRADRSGFCSDVGGGPVEETWRATKGTLTVTHAPDDGQRRVRTIYRAAIRIEGAEFVNSAGARVTQSQPIALTVIVR
jgi:hypothetical protein